MGLQDTAKHCSKAADYDGLALSPLFSKEAYHRRHTPDKKGKTVPNACSRATVSRKSPQIVSDSWRRAGRRGLRAAATARLMSDRQPNGSSGGATGDRSLWNDDDFGVRQSEVDTGTAWANSCQTRAVERAI